MNLKNHHGNVTGDALAQCMALVQLDKRHLAVTQIDVMGCLDAPAEINTGRMVHVGAQQAPHGLIEAAEFQTFTQRDGWVPRRAFWQQQVGRAKR
jgi:hypothetical protein